MTSPVFIDLAVFQPEDLDDGALYFRVAHGMDVEDDVIAFGNDALDFAAGIGIVLL